MENELILLKKISPLYILVLIGYLAGKFFAVDRKSVASLIFYFIIPVVFFNYALKIEMQFRYIFLPIFIFIFSAGLSVLFWKLGRAIWPRDKFANILAFSAGSGNTGYFGLPVAMMVFDQAHVAVYMLAAIGVSIFDYTLGAYYFVRSQLSKKQAIKKVLKLPMLYAFAFGVCLNYFDFILPSQLEIVVESMRGAYVTLGMMIIGFGIAEIDKVKISWSFATILLIAKFFIVPGLMILAMQLDLHLFNFFRQDVWDIMLLLSFVPPAANTVIFAQLHNCHPEETAATILLGNLVAVFFTPIAVSYFIN